MNTTEHKKILIIDDDEDFLSILDMKFKKEGFLVVIAKDGEEGIRIAKSENPNIILLDMALPKKGGIEVLEDLKSDEVSKNIPVIILSNFSEDENIKKATSLGATDYFIKADSSILEIFEKVQKIVSK
jgi:DNA-binding response OmpR family regulator